MKDLLIIFSLLITSVSWSKDINFYDLVVRDGLYYKKFTDKPFIENDYMIYLAYNIIRSQQDEIIILNEYLHSPYKHLSNLLT